MRCAKTRPARRKILETPLGPAISLDISRKYGMPAIVINPLSTDVMTSTGSIDTFSLVLVLAL